MTEEEKKIRNKVDEIIKKLIPSPKSDKEEFYVSCIKVACVEITEQLQQENNRLVVDLETLRLHDEEEIGMLQSENRNLKEQLEQAKGIIQKAVFQNICYNCDYGIDHCSQCRNGTLRKQAEQFLKE